MVRDVLGACDRIVSIYRQQRSISIIVGGRMDGRGEGVDLDDEYQSRVWVMMMCAFMWEGIIGLLFEALAEILIDIPLMCL